MCIYMYVYTYMYIYKKLSSACLTPFHSRRKDVEEVRQEGAGKGTLHFG